MFLASGVYSAQYLRGELTEFMDNKGWKVIRCQVKSYILSQVICRMEGKSVLIEMGNNKNSLREDDVWGNFDIS